MLAFELVNQNMGTVEGEDVKWSNLRITLETGSKMSQFDNWPFEKEAIRSFQRVVKRLLTLKAKTFIGFIF